MSERSPEPIHERSSNAEDSVAQLLRLAGHRPAVPARDAAIVKEAARAEWRRAVKAQRRKRFLFGGAGSLLAAAAVLLLVLNPRIQDAVWPGSKAPVATVVTTSGAVTLAGQGPEGLQAGAEIETAGDGRAILQLADGSSLRLDVDSRLRLVSGSVLDLDRGAIYVDSPPASGSLELRTPLGVARDIGTRFEVRLPTDTGSLLLRVRDGEVELTRGDDVHRAFAGEEIEILADGTAQQRPLAAGSLLWLGALLPSYPREIELSPVAEFLEWAAGESGLEVVDYVDVDARNLCVSLERSGPTAGLTLGEAVTLALPSQLEHRVTGDHLVIDWKRTAGVP